MRPQIPPEFPSKAHAELYINAHARNNRAQ